MRLTVLKMILMMSLLTTYGRVNSQKIISSLRLENVSLSEALEKVEELSDYDFIFSYDDVEGYLVSANMQSVTLEECLDNILEELPFAFDTEDDFVVVSYNKFESVISEQEKQITIKGKVTDKNGDGLPGVSVVIKDSNVGVATDMDGNYVISTLKESFVLTFSFVGMVSKEITYTGQQAINVVLLDNEASLNEVVVTGMFKRKAESFTGSAVTMKADDLKRAGNGNIFESLKNLDPSLNLIPNLDMGSDPNALPEMEIRGTTTFPSGGLDTDLKSNFMGNPNAPLFILDGFRVDVSTVFDLDIDRIQSVTILKDAAAKAIYGSRAANGVIVLETKRPLIGNTRVYLTSSLNITSPDLTSYDLANAAQKMAIEENAKIWEGDRIGDFKYKEPEYLLRKRLLSEGVDTDWINKPLRTGIGHKQSIGVEIGEQKMTMLLNFAYNKEAGVMRNSERENLSGSINLRYRHKDLIFRNILSITDNKGTDSNYGDFSTYALANPYFPTHTKDGEIFEAKGFSNPLGNIDLNTVSENKYLNITNNFYAEWKITPELKLTSNLGLSIKNTESHYFFPAAHTMFDEYEEEDEIRKGSYNMNTGKQKIFSSSVGFEFNKTIDKHYISANFSLRSSDETYNEVVNYTEGFPNDKMSDITFALQYADNKTPLGMEGKVRDIGIVGLMAYTYDDRFLTDVTVRRNGSSQFGKKNRWGTFYSLGLGWNLHNEKFMQEINFIKKQN